MNVEQPSSNSNVLLILVILLLILPLCCACTLCGMFVFGVGVAGSSSDIDSFDEIASVFDEDRESATETYSETFDVEGRVALAADLEVGSLEIEVGEDDRVVVEGEIEVFRATVEEAEDALDEIEIDATRSGNTIRVDADWDQGAGFRLQSPRVELRVTVPESTEVDITANVGEVTVRDINGDVQIVAEVGSVVLRDVLPRTTLDVEASAGRIDFRGALADDATYDLSGEVGEIDVEVPEDSSFEIDARSDVGDVTVDFDVDGTSEREFLSQSVEGVVGDADSGTLLRIRTRVGAITVSPM